MKIRCRDVSKFENLDNSQPHTYAQSWTTLCSNTSAGNHRLRILVGIYSETSPLNLANFSLISCIPSYWQKSGPLTVSIQPDISPRFVLFMPNKHNDQAILILDDRRQPDILHLFRPFQNYCRGRVWRLHLVVRGYA
jgi:hypothetical protein